MNIKYPYKLALLAVFSLTGVFIVGGSSPVSAAASCVNNSGNHNDYANIVVNVQWMDKAGNIRQFNDGKVRVTTVASTSASGGNNIIQTNSGERHSTAVFDQITRGDCGFNNLPGATGSNPPGDTTNVIIGYNFGSSGSPQNTSPNNYGDGPWALDCDEADRGIGNGTRFEISGAGVPSAADGRTNSGNWGAVQDITSRNGRTDKITVTWYESQDPPPPPCPVGAPSAVPPCYPTTVTGNINVDCQYVAGGFNNATFRYYKVFRNGIAAANVIGWGAMDAAGNIPAPGLSIDGVALIGQGDTREDFFIRGYQNAGNPADPTTYSGVNPAPTPQFVQWFDCVDDSVEYTITADCTTVYIRGLYDPDGGDVSWNLNSGQSGAGRGDIDVAHGVSAGSNAGFSITMNAGNIGPSGPNSIVTQSNVAKSYSVPPPDCFDDPPSFTISADCSTIRLRNMNDPDTPGAGLSYSGGIYQRVGATQGVLAQTLIGAGTDVDIPYDAQALEDGVNGGFVIIVGVYNNEPDGFGGGQGAYVGEQRVDVGPCFSATCTISIVTNVPGAPAGSNNVDARQPYTINYSITNTGPLPMPGTMAGSGERTSLSNNVGPTPAFARHVDGRPLAVGSTMNGSFSAPAINRIGSFGANGYASYASSFRLGADCSPGPSIGPSGGGGGGGSVTGPPGGPGTGRVSTYDEFRLTPIATAPVFDNEETPTTVTFTRSVNEVTPRGASLPGWIGARATATRTATYQRFGTPAPVIFAGTGAWPAQPGNGSESVNFITRNYGFSRPPPAGFGGGDEFCSRVVVGPSTGFAGPGSGNNVFQPGPAADSGAPPAGCSKIYDEPYMRVYGNDVSAGGDFRDPACTITTAARIDMFTRNLSGIGRGSGAQMAVFAQEKISGFPSTTTKSAAPSGKIGLSFSNTFNNTNTNEAEGGGSSNRPRSGGGFASGPCIPNYFEETQYSDAEEVSPGVPRKVNVAGFAGPVSTASLPNPQTVVGSNATVTGGALGLGERRSLLVNGDVYISGNVVYDTNWTAIADIPSFYLIVNGNIFIDKDVTRLDGTYIAQPRAPGVGGNIFTCYEDPGVPVPVASLKPTCDRQLVINGSFVAEKVHFLRTHRTIRDSPALPNTENPLSPVAPAAGPTVAAAAEIFNFTSETYLAVPALRPLGGSANSQYDYITALPPVL